MNNTDWQGKPYYSLDAWCKKTYGHKCKKIALNAHMTCPNRDGSLGTRGCIFCSAGGSGDFAVDIEDFPVISSAQEDDTPCTIAYFQAYTNTYAPLPYLEQVFSRALASPSVCGISIATRPDCLPEEVIGLLLSLKKLFPGKFIWIELGLQSIHEATAAYIRRGYPLSCFEECVGRLQAAKIPVIVHVILGLPGETEAQLLQTIRYLNQFQIFGIKLQLLHVLKGTDLAADYSTGKFEVLSKDAYLELLISCLEHLSPETVVHRLTGDGPKDLLIAPDWSRNKKDVLNTLHKKMRLKSSYQGKTYD
ncbi:MAG: TIGR01212 family radical SAM protein [Acetatifactor sp.]